MARTSSTGAVVDQFGIEVSYIVEEGLVDLPVLPPLEPMLARAESLVPSGAQWSYEPKWDGFRALIFRDGQHLEIHSRGEKPLTRYFPELWAPLLEALPNKVVVDGEIVIQTKGILDFDSLLSRIHPASSRVEALSKQSPATFVAFDLVALGGVDLRKTPFAQRRQALEELMSGALGGDDAVWLGEEGKEAVLSPVTLDRDVALRWFVELESAGLDGIVAKKLDSGYEPGRRTMVKVKHERTADVVVGGFRWRTEGSSVASLLLGLYDEAGVLQHVGVTSSFTDARRKELVEKIRPYWISEVGSDEDLSHPWHRRAENSSRQPGGQSRWTSKRDVSWQPLRPQLVAEVRYDHLQGDRFRHATTFVRWRDDRDASSCTYSQLDFAPSSQLAKLLSVRSEKGKFEP